jgi:hypothetical protein
MIQHCNTTLQVQVLLKKNRCYSMKISISDNWTNVAWRNDDDDELSVCKMPPALFILMKWSITITPSPLQIPGPGRPTGKQQPHPGPSRDHTFTRTSLPRSCSIFETGIAAGRLWWLPSYSILTQSEDHSRNVSTHVKSNRQCLCPCMMHGWWSGCQKFWPCLDAGFGEGRITVLHYSNFVFIW